MPHNTSASILIVDDDQEIAELVDEGVSAIGQYRTDTAHSGSEALEKVERNMPDLVLLDIMLKDMDGTEVCRAIKKDERTSHIPVIALTVIHKNERKRSAEIMDSGVDEHLEKPFSFDDLNDSIERHLKYLSFPDTGDNI